MWVIANQTIMTSYGRKEQGDKFNVTKSYGDQLIKNGYVEEVEHNEEETIALTDVAKADSYESDPTDNTSSEEETGTAPNPLVPEDTLKVKEEKEGISTKEEKAVKKTK